MMSEVHESERATRLIRFARLFTASDCSTGSYSTHHHPAESGAPEIAIAREPKRSLATSKQP
jgi:hypothetical protein